MDDFKSITVKSVMVNGKKELEIHNPAGLPLVGAGAQGAVFRLSSGKCVKIYVDPRTAYWEAKALLAANGSPYFPKLYRHGSRYVVMEYLKGPTLRDYLLEHPGLTESFAAQLLALLKEMRRLKFSRIDTRTAHLIVTEGGRLKAIDHSGAYRTVRRAPFMLLRSLHRAGCLQDFLKYVARHDPKLYMKWRKKRAEGTDLGGVPRLPRIGKLLDSTEKDE